MNDKTYNVYIKMIKLACKNVKDELCKFNMFKGNEIDVKIRNKDTLVNFVEQIVTHPKNAVTLYSGRVDKYIVVRSSEPMLRMLTAGEIFVESIINSYEARIAQKKIMEYGSVEKFLLQAYVYDSRHPYSDKNDSAIEKAKKVIVNLYSLAVLSVFDFSGIKPCLNESIRLSLEEKAYNPAFSFFDRSTMQGLIDKKYDAVFVDKVNVFSIKAESKTEAKPKNAIKRIPLQSKEIPITSKTLLLTDLYKGMFSTLPLNSKRRRLINLRSRHNDIMLAKDKHTLLSKRQYASIEFNTKHNYIMDFYSDQMPADYDVQSKAKYLFKQENKMYKYMWGALNSVHYKQGRLYFPDGTNMVVPKEYAPHDFFHKVNVTYAALFGFTADDRRGGSEWLYDAIRKAYTDEGTAEYRLNMIEARLSGNIK